MIALRSIDGSLAFSLDSLRGLGRSLGAVPGIIALSWGRSVSLLYAKIRSETVEQVRALLLNRIVRILLGCPAWLQNVRPHPDHELHKRYSRGAAGYGSRIRASGSCHALASGSARPFASRCEDLEPIPVLRD